MDQNRVALMRYAIYSKFAAQMGERFSILRDLYRDPTIDGDKLERELDKHYDAIIELAKNAHIVSLRMIAKGDPDLP